MREVKILGPGVKVSWNVIEVRGEGENRAAVSVRKEGYMVRFGQQATWAEDGKSIYYTVAIIQDIEGKIHCVLPELIRVEEML